MRWPAIGYAVYSSIRSGFGLTGRTATAAIGSSESEGDIMATLTTAEKAPLLVGIATINVTKDGRSGSVEVTVTDAPLTVTLGTPEPK